MQEEILIRSAEAKDVEAMRNIYAHYVENTAVSFEYESPSIEEFLARMEHIQQRFPFLVAQAGPEILGYANTKPFISRAAYDWSAETTIYLHPNCRRRGIGRRLYTVLEEISILQNLTNLNACIGDPEDPSDPYLNRDSELFHSRLGYQFVGRFHHSGYKFGRWYHMIWMEKILQHPPKDPPTVVPYPDLEPEQLRKAGLWLP